MATQGLISITDQYGNMKFKIVAGSDGYNVKKVVTKIKKKAPKLLTIESIIKMCDGLLNSLVVMSHDGKVGGDFDMYDEISQLYFSTLNNPFFNPRRNLGWSGYTEIIIMFYDYKPT